MKESEARRYRYNIRSVLVINTYLINYQFIGISVKSLVGGSLVSLQFRYLNKAEAFHRPIPTEELWKYQYKTHNNTVETSVLLVRF